MNYCYDLHFILPVAPSLKKYRQRLEDMKRYGFLNVGKARVLVTLLSEDCTLVTNEEMTAGWPEGVVAEVKRMPYLNVHHKFQLYYTMLTMLDVQAAPWHIRIDDDSATDVSTLLVRLEQYSNGGSGNAYYWHLVAAQCNNNCDVLNEYKQVLYRFGFTDSQMKRLHHSFEISIDSAALFKLLLNDKPQQLFRELLLLGQKRTYYTDQVYCYNVRLAASNVVPTSVGFLSKDPNVGKFSFFGEDNPFVHIHYLSHDQHPNKWKQFTEGVKAVDAAGSQRIS